VSQAALTILLFAILLAVACRKAPSADEIADMQSRLKHLSDDSMRVGRYQIVNGMPSTERNIILLDTETGRTWILCNGKAAQGATSTNWCAMDFITAGAQR